VDQLSLKHGVCNWDAGRLAQRGQRISHRDEPIFRSNPRNRKKDDHGFELPRTSQMPVEVKEQWLAGRAHRKDSIKTYEQIPPS
jgi:hypothetical protein